MSDVAAKAMSLLGAKARPSSIDPQKGLCCYGVVYMSLHGIVELPALEEVQSCRLSEAVRLLSKSLVRSYRPKVGDVALFRNHGLNRRRIAEAHLGIVIDVSVVSIVHSDLASREVKRATLEDMQSCGLDLISYWRVN